MWYDKYPGIPPRGSPLEAVFTRIYVQRQQVELMGTRAMVLSSLADNTAATRKAVEGFQEFCDSIFPFFEKAAELDKERDIKRLMEHVAKPMRIDIGSIKAERAAAARAKAHNKFKLRTVEIPGILKRNQ